MPAPLTSSLPVANQEHSIYVDHDKCTGCVLCLEACPNKAIRLRRGLAWVQSELCVDCGECFRVCPQGAIRAVITPLERAADFQQAVAVPSPVLYSQFGYETTPNQLLLGLKKLGFGEVVDMAWVCEMTALAMEEYLIEHPELRPGISAVCPAVVRLIAVRFPSLLPKVLPISPPRLVAAKGIKTRLTQRYGWDEEEVGVFHLAPCAAKMAVVHNRAAADSLHLDGVIGMNQIYGPLLKALKQGDERRQIQKSSGAGISWAMSGGQAMNVDVKHTLAVCGFNDVLRILEMLEAGRLTEIRFLEALICPGGCLGGPLCVENPFRAKSVTMRMVKRYGAHSRVQRSKVRQMMSEGLFELERLPQPQPKPPLDPDPAQAILKMQAIDHLAESLPGRECGVCGAPDCRTFAEDVVLGRVQEDECPFLTANRRQRRDAKGRNLVTVGEIVDNLGLQVAAGKKGLDRRVLTGYVSDLLSDVMANAPAGAVWLTIQGHQNIVAVGILKELAAVCLVGGRQPDPDTLAKADEQGLPILLSGEDAYRLAGKLHQLGVGPGS